MSVTYEPGSTDWRPNRGDYGTEYAFDLIAIIERLNCAKGCRFADDANNDEWGPGGSCEVLARVSLPDVVPELDPRPDGPFCRKREAPPKPEPVPPEPEMTEPMFEMGEKP